MAMSGMADEAARHRASALCSDAQVALQQGKILTAADLAREALSLDSASLSAKQLLTRLRSPNTDALATLVEKVRTFVSTESESDGQAALALLKQQPHIASDEQGQQCIKILLRKCKISSPTDDKLTAAVLSASKAARRFVYHRFDEHATETFRLFWHRGDLAYAAFIAIILDSVPATGTEHRPKAIRGAFQLALSHVIDAGENHLERAITTVSRLLATNAECVLDLIDYDVFEIILPLLDVREFERIRKQALLAIITLLKLTKDVGEAHLKAFIVDKVEKQRHEDLIIALSVAAALFPVVTNAMAAMLLTEGFIQQLLPMLQRNSHSLSERKSQTLELAALTFFSAACVDKTCRVAIAKSSIEWLGNVAKSGDEPENAASAAVVLAKFGQTETTEQSSSALKAAPDTVHLARSFIALLNDNATISNEAQQKAVEGLAYSSLTPAVKELLVEDSQALSNLVKIIVASTAENSSIYGVLTIIDNLTTYRIAESEEQRKLSELRDYANARKPAEEDPLSTDKRVRLRCLAVVQSGIVAAIFNRKIDESEAVSVLTAHIIRSLSQEQKHRGLLAQQGAIKGLLFIVNSASPSSTKKITRLASHGLARMLISVNPNHVFGASSPAISALRPLLGLITSGDDAEQDGDLLPTFEALLALTNLASMQEDTVREVMIREAWPQIEELLLHKNAMIQRATVELVCNLMASPQCVAKYADGSKQSGTRLRIVLALADAEDLATRKAAGGALAILTEWDAAVNALLDDDRGVKILLSMCDDEDDEMKHRAIVCLVNLVSAPGKAGMRGIEAVKAQGGVQVVGSAVQKARISEIRRLGLDLLRKIS